MPGNGERRATSQRLCARRSGRTCAAGCGDSSTVSCAWSVSFPWPLRLVSTTDPEVLTRVLGVVTRGRPRAVIARAGGAPSAAGRDRRGDLRPAFRRRSQRQRAPAHAGRRRRMGLRGRAHPMPSRPCTEGSPCCHRRSRPEAAMWARGYAASSPQPDRLGARDHSRRPEAGLAGPNDRLSPISSSGSETGLIGLAGASGSGANASRVRLRERVALGHRFPTSASGMGHCARGEQTPSRECRRSGWPTSMSPERSPRTNSC